jgi:hypothetical protein
MDHLTAYYIHQGGGGRIHVIGPVFVGSPLVQRGNGIGSFLGSLLRIVMLVLESGAGAVGRETLRTGARILSHIADKSPNKNVKDIIVKSVVIVDL